MTAIQDDRLFYRDGYKGWTTRRYRAATGLRPSGGRNRVALDGVITLDAAGQLVLEAGFAWDYDSGPAIDARASKRASAEHDAKLQLIRAGMVSREYLKLANREYAERIREDGGWWMRRWAGVRHWVLDRLGVRGWPSEMKKELVAP